MRIRLVPAGKRARRFECFSCGTEVIAPFTIGRCPNCSEEDNVYLMD